VLPSAPSDTTKGESEPALGVEEGGIHSAEALMLARYFMFSQLYLHPVRRIYDIHLKDFLKAWLPNGQCPTDVGGHLDFTDNEVTAALLSAARKPGSSGHEPARRIVEREHFRVAYERHPDDVRINAEAGRSVFEKAQKHFPADMLRWDRYPGKGGAPEFPVKTRDDRIVSSLALSDTLRQLPALSFDFVFADRGILSQIQKWIKDNRTDIIKPVEGE
jgi:hypothetical protein